MGYKCTPQIMGLVRGEPKPGQKHRANGGKILREAGEERYSASPTLDRSRSDQNEYTGYRSGGECWEAMEAEADAYRVTGTTKDGREFSRALRSDAVIGVAVIFNPPHDMAEGWTAEQYQRFYRDSAAVLEQIEPRLFRRDNVRMTAEHWDEGLQGADGEYGRHRHEMYSARDTDGRYCGNLVDAKLLTTINQRYPQMMRARGWALDDLDTTDWARAKADPEYREERRTKRRQSGRSVAGYVADKASELVAQAEALREQGEGVLAALQAEQSRLDAEAARSAQERAETERREKILATRERALEGLQDEAELTLAEAQVARRNWWALFDGLSAMQQAAARKRFEAQRQAADKAIQGASDRVQATQEAMERRDKGHSGPKFQR